jgi:hypothetical protein
MNRRSARFVSVLGCIFITLVDWAACIAQYGGGGGSGYGGGYGGNPYGGNGSGALSNSPIRSSTPGFGPGNPIGYGGTDKDYTHCIYQQYNNWPGNTNQIPQGLVPSDCGL